MKIVRNLDPENWREFVRNHPDGNIFHTPEMFAVFEQAKGYTPTVWAVVDQREVPLALLLPVDVTLMGGVLYWLTTRAVVYGSVLCEPSKAGCKALRYLLQVYKSEMQGSILFTELRNLIDMSPLDPLLQDLQFTFEGHLNYLIDLDRSVDLIMQDIGRRTRKQIRKGLRDGLVQVRTVENRTELRHWYQVLKQTYSHSQVPLADPSLFEAAFDILHPKGMAVFLLAEIDGQTASCSVELPFKETIYGWYGGTDRQFSKYVPNELLMWHVLSWGATQGYKVYDFGGAGKPDEEYGVRDFKAKFGGELVNYGRYQLTHAPTRLFVSELAYQVYRRLL